MRGIEQEVEKKLRKDQESKTFKDAGRRVGGSKKERSAYKNLIRLSDLVSLEEDSVTAAEMVVKDKVYPKIDPQEERDRGVSSGTAFLKYEVRASFPGRPKVNNPAARKFFVGLAETLHRDLNTCVNVKDLETLFKRYYNWKGSDVPFLIDTKILKSIDSKDELDMQYSAWTIRRMIADLAGKTFYNLIFRFSKPSALKWKNAFYYEGITTGQASDNLNNWNEYYQKRINDLKVKIDEFKSYDRSELATQRLKYSGGPKDLAEFRQAMVYQFNRDIESYERKINNLPEAQKEHPESWAWAEKKERKEPVKKAEIQINSGVALSYIKRTGGLEITTVTEEEIINLFGFTGVEFGNYMRDNESREHVRHFLGACADMFEVLNFNAIQVNKMNGLAISFGSRGHGRALASYFPSRQIINITKSRGDGTLAHEWAHFLDNLLFHKVFIGGYAKRPYASGEPNYLKIGAIQSAISELMKYIYQGDGALRKIPLRFYAQEQYIYDYLIGETLEKSIENAKINVGRIFWDKDNLVKDQHRVFGYIAHAHNLDFIEVEISTLRRSLYYHYSAQLNEYWIKPWEMFARAFETYLYDKLDKAGRVNNYLVSGVYFDHSAKVYPFGEEREKLYQLYDALMAAIKKELGIMDFEPFTNVRTNEYIQFDENSEEEKVTGGVIVASTLSELLLLEMEFFKLN